METETGFPENESTSWEGVGKSWEGVGSVWKNAGKGMENRRKSTYHAQTIEEKFFRTVSEVIIVGFVLLFLTFALVVFSIMQFQLVVILCGVLTFTLFCLLVGSLVIGSVYLAIRFILRPIVLLYQSLRSHQSGAEIEDEEDVVEAIEGGYNGSDEGVTLVIDEASDVSYSAPREVSDQKPQAPVLSDEEFARYRELISALVA